MDYLLNWLDDRDWIRIVQVMDRIQWVVYSLVFALIPVDISLLIAGYR